MSIKQLYLIRHAQAISGVDDFNRELSETGRRQWIEVVKRAAQVLPAPQQILCSSAKRTQTTAELLVKTWPCLSVPLQAEKRLYNSDFLSMLHYLQTQPDNIERLALVAHNPGISLLVGYLTDHAIQAPPGGFYLVNFALDTWAAVAKGLGTLQVSFHPEGE